MKFPLLALLCVGTAAFCQSPTPQKVDPDKLFQMPDKFAQRAPEQGRLRPQPFLWNKSIQGDTTIPAIPRLIQRDTTIPAAPRLKMNDHQIDPKIILHPPWRSQSKGQDVAHRLYPGLKFLPLNRGPRIPR
jgi:hypothetical protein